MTSDPVERARRQRLLLIASGLVAVGALVVAVVIATSSGSSSTSSTSSTSSSSHRGTPPLTSGVTPWTGGQQASASSPAALPLPGVVAGLARIDYQRVSSYNYLDLSQSQAGALAASTPRFQTQLRAIYSTIDQIAPANHAVQNAQATAAGVTDLSPTTASVLLFADNQFSSTETAGSTRVAKVSVVVTLVKQGPTWLVDALDQVTGSNASVGTAQFAWADANGRAAAVAADTEVRNLLTFTQATLAQDVQRMADGATGTLRSTLLSSQATLAQSRVASTGHAVAIGIVSVGTTQATVLAATTQMKSGGAPQTSRLRLTLVDVAGRWLVSELASE